MEGFQNPSAMYIFGKGEISQKALIELRHIKHIKEQYYAKLTQPTKHLF